MPPTPHFLDGIGQGAGTAIFAAGGAWLPQGGIGPPGSEGRPALVLSRPERILQAASTAEIGEVLALVDDAQAQGRYVAGYLAYEAGAAFGLATQEVEPGRLREQLALASDDLLPGSVPLAWLAVYPPEAAFWVEPPPPPDGRGNAGTPIPEPSAPMLDVTYEEYARAIACVRELIAAGDTYQVNYTVRARFNLGRDPLDYFLERSTAHPVPYAAYLDLGEAQVVTLSPELFLQRRGDLIESRPMKGTRPRRGRAHDDVELAYQLIGSEKDRAENLMIVDMVRNDLGRICLPGTVAVPSLFTVEPYATVWQMSSTVTGRLIPGTGVAGIMAATFPGASITGAPKHHTMEIIRDVEKEPRGVYTGFVGLFLPGGDFTCNLCIRTLVHRGGRCLLGVGSGVVWDSDAEEEYEETLTKASFAFPAAQAKGEPPRPRQAGAAAGVGRAPAAAGTGRARPPRSDASAETSLGLFETLLLEAVAPDQRPIQRGAVEPGDQLFRYRFLTEHLARMRSSANELCLHFTEEEARRQLSELALSTPSPAVVRLQLDREGTLSPAVRPVPSPVAGPVRVLLSPFRTDPDDPLLRHKTTVRPLYDREYRRAVDSGCYEVLFLNRLDRLTEGAISNVFVRLGAEWITPPLADGLLPGIWRAHFLSQHSGDERSLGIEELLCADEVLIGNSVRGTVAVGSLVPDSFTGLF